MCHNIVKAVPLGSVLKPFIFVKEVGFLPKDVQSNTTRAEVLTRPRPPPSLQIAFVILRLSASWWAGAISRWKCELWKRNQNGVSQTALLRDSEMTTAVNSCDHRQVCLFTVQIFGGTREGVGSWFRWSCCSNQGKITWIVILSGAAHRDQWFVSPPAQWFPPPVNQIEWSLVTQSSWYYTTPPIGSHNV